MASSPRGPTVALSLTAVGWRGRRASLAAGPCSWVGQSGGVGANGTVGIGFIGCGEIAHLHASALRDAAAAGLPVVPVAAADPDPDHRSAVSRNFPFARGYDRAEDLLAD